MTGPAVYEYLEARHRLMRQDRRMLVNQVRRRQDRQVAAVVAGLAVVLAAAVWRAVR